MRHQDQRIEKPILFSAPMIKAIKNMQPDIWPPMRINPDLPGKSKTRRIVTPREIEWAPGCSTKDFEDIGRFDFREEGEEGHINFVRRAYLKQFPGVSPGILRPRYGVNQLWVRETWRAIERKSDSVDGVLFAADDHFEPIENTAAAGNLWCEAYNNGKYKDQWRPSIFMPRWASRFDLQIKSVQVERLQDITSDEVIAEGFVTSLRKPDSIPDLIGQFGHCWNKINGKGSWESNPWVWVVEFMRLAKPAAEREVA